MRKWINLMETYSPSQIGKMVKKNISRQQQSYFPQT